MKSVRLHPEAESESIGAVEWYKAKSSAASMDFNVELNMLVDFVRRYPQQSATHMLQTRRAVFGKFPFAIIYRDMLDEIQIIAVAHTSRRPGYWRRRSF